MIANQTSATARSNPFGVAVAEQRVKCLEADRRRELLQKLQKQQHSQWVVQANREIDETASELFLSNWKRS